MKNKTIVFSIFPGTRYLNFSKNFLKLILRTGGKENKTKKNKIIFAADEILTNIILHEKSNDKTLSPISVSCEVTKDFIEIIIKSKGKKYSFDKESSADSLKNKYSGAGLKLVKSMVDSVTYNHLDMKNKITLRQNYD